MTREILIIEKRVHKSQWDSCILSPKCSKLLMHDQTVREVESYRDGNERYQHLVEVFEENRRVACLLPSLCCSVYSVVCAHAVLIVFLEAEKKPLVIRKNKPPKTAQTMHLGPKTGHGRCCFCVRLSAEKEY